MTLLILTDPGPLSLPLQPNYNSDEETWAAQIGGAYKRDQWWRLQTEKLLLPRLLGKQLLQRINQPLTWEPENLNSYFLDLH